MGTNYYIKKKERRVREPDLHIGKNSYGWEFHFQAYYEDEYYRTPELKSKQQWMEYIFLNSDSIYDEYDDNVSLEEFIELLELKKPGSVREHDNHKNLNHHNECKKSGYKYTYNDNEGWSFSTTDFS